MSINHNFEARSRNFHFINGIFEFFLELTSQSIVSRTLLFFFFFLQPLIAKKCIICRTFFWGGGRILQHLLLRPFQVPRTRDQFSRILLENVASKRCQRGRTFVCTKNLNNAIEIPYDVVINHPNQSLAFRFDFLRRFPCSRTPVKF